jgi:hypothetical protein
MNQTPLTLESDGSATFAGNISGSSTSTGSFGSAHIADKVGIATSTPKSGLHTLFGGSIIVQNYRQSFVSDGGTEDAGDAAYIYRSQDGASYPFSLWGNLIFQGNTSATKGQDIVFATGTTPATRMVIDDTGNVGIGTTSPNANLEVYTSDGSATLNIKGEDNAILRLISDYDANGTNDAKIAFYNDGVNAGDATWAIGHDGSDSEKFKISQGEQVDTDAKLTIQTDGNVGIGTESPGYNLEVAGTFYSAGSSVAYKENIEELEVDSSLIHSLRAVSYDYKKKYKDFGHNVKEGKQLGLISEEVAETIPELAIMKDGKPKNVDYQKLAVVLLKEVQNLKKEVEELKK